MVKPQTVLFVDHASALGGAEHSLLLLLRHLSKDMYEPHLVCSAGPLSVEAKKLHINVNKMDFPRLRHASRAIADFPATTRTLAQTARKIDARCLYANTVRAAIYAAPAARLARIQFVWHMRDFWLSENKPRHIWIDTILKRILCVAASHVIVNSHAVAQQLPRCKSLTVVHNGIEVTEFNPDLDAKAFRAQYGLTAETPLVGMIGRLRPWKGQDRFLRIAARVRDQYPNAHFVIVGGTPFGGADDYVNELKRSTEELGLSSTVTFTGQLRDVRPALAAIDVFVHPGNPEPFGLVNIEAMAMQTPVVAFAHGALPEIVQNNITGILIPPGNEESLADAIVTLLSDPEHRGAYGKAARNRVENHFDIATTAEKIDDVLRQVMML